MVKDILETSHSRLLKLGSWGVEYRRYPLLGKHFTLPSRGLRRARMLVVPEWRGKRVGSAVVRALLEQVKARGVALRPKVMVVGLLVEGGRAAGAVGVHRITGEPVVIRARAVVLAAADCSFRGQYACVDQTTGDAFRLAYDAGASLDNLEFLVVNTGPPTFGFEGTGVATRFGAKLLNGRRERFMRRYRPEWDKAEVCYLVQAMAAQVAEGRGPPFFMDMSNLRGRLVTRRALRDIGGWMPIQIARVEEAGVRLFGEAQPWGPAVQSLRGGVRTDIDCMSDLPGLLAAGTSQSVDPGMFNGWSSMRAMWSGERAGRTAARFAKGSSDVSAGADLAASRLTGALAPLGRASGLSPDQVYARIQTVLFPAGVCIRKREDRLQGALDEIVRIRQEEVPALRAADPHGLVKAIETENMALAAELFLRASLERRESRGDHFREDWPQDGGIQELAWVSVRKGADGRPLIGREPVPLDRYPVRPPDGAESSP